MDNDGVLSAGEGSPMEVDEPLMSSESPDTNNSKKSSIENPASDSGYSESVFDNKNTDEGTANLGENTKPNKKGRIKIIYDDSESDDDEDTVRKDNDKEQDEPQETVSKSKFKMFDSDEDEEGENATKDEIFENKNGKKKPKIKIIRESDDDEEVENDDISTKEDEENSESNDMKKKLSKLCDSDSSEDESPVNEKCKSPVFDGASEDLKSYREDYKSKKRLDNEDSCPEFKVTTLKDAQKQRMEIQSVSQKMTRESDARLPYHRPKQRSLKEFLEKRKKFSDSVDIPIEKKMPSVSIKITNQHIELISKKLEEREKEVVQFFKSDSEAEDEDDDKSDEDYVPDGDSQKDDIEKEQDSTDFSSTIEEKNQQNTVNEMEENCDNGNTTEGDGKKDSSEYSCDTNIPDTNESENNQNMEDSLSNKNKDLVNADYMKEMLGSDCNEEKEECEDSLKMSIDFSNDDHPKDIGDSNHNDFIEETSNEYLDSISEINTLSSIEDLDKIKEQKKLERKKLLLEQIGNVQPKLSGGPNYLIDLVENTTKPDEVCQLMERFIHHNSKKKCHKGKVQVSVVTVSGTGEIHKEQMSVALDDNDTQPTLVETPGEKLKKLREELEKQMAEQRTKLWEQRMSKRNNEVEEGEMGDDDMAVYKGEKDECCDREDGGKDDGINCDNEENEENNDDDDDDDEAMDDNDDDDEVEDENSKEENMLDDQASEDDNEEDENNEGIESSSELENEEENEKELLTKSAKKRLKRIIMNDDSESDDEDDQRSHSRGRNKTNSTESFESVFQPGQNQTEFTPEKNRHGSKPELAFLTPISNLTGLQSLNSGSKFLQESPKPHTFQLPMVPSPLKGWQKNLFPEQTSGENNSDDDNDAEMEENSQTQLDESKDDIEPELPPSTQDLLDLCSGKFTGFTQQQNLPEKSTQSGFTKITDDSQSKTDIFENQSSSTFKNTLTNAPNTSTGVSNFETPNVPDVTACIVDDDDKLISQILDEEEMERFKKKFVSPVTRPSQVNTDYNFGIPASIKFDSDEDDDNAGDDEEEEDEDDVAKVAKKKRKNPSALIDSDEEDATEEPDECLNEEEECEEDGDIDELLKEDKDRNVEYDSEENEIEITADSKPKKIKLQDFFENEAELSESEWGSADEDENNLDQMDIELGDEDNFDQNKVRRDLEKIHMRQLLDEDKREVKILQELLLEDGELHGTGRQRQFRWKNMDASGTNPDPDGNAQKENDDSVLEEDDNEEEWRKKRFEREEFLRKLKEQDGEESRPDIKTGSQTMKLGHKFVVRNRVQVEKKVIAEPVKKLQPMQAIRGSFLARTDQVLSRVAEFTKEATMAGGAATSKKHFVFHTISLDKMEEVDKKRKASEVGTPQAIKKMRIENLSPAFQKSGNNRKKNLFSNN